MVAAIATASITGSVRAKSPVISDHARQRRQRRAGGGGEHRAHRDHRVQGRVARGRAEDVVHDVAEGHPGGDADEQDGANTPDPPIPMVRPHAAILPNASRTRNHSPYWPAVALSITGYPTPYICGTASSSRPSSDPADSGAHATPARPYHTRPHRSSLL